MQKNSATPGELHSQLYNQHEAKQYFEKAIWLTNSPVEKKLLKKKVEGMVRMGKQ